MWSMPTVACRSELKAMGWTNQLLMAELRPRLATRWKNGDLKPESTTVHAKAPSESPGMRSGERLCDIIGENSRRKVQNVVTDSTASPQPNNGCSKGPKQLNEKSRNYVSHSDLMRFSVHRFLKNCGRDD